MTLSEGSQSLISASAKTLFSATGKSPLLCPRTNRLGPSGHARHLIIGEDDLPMFRCTLWLEIGSLVQTEQMAALYEIPPSRQPMPNDMESYLWTLHVNTPHGCQIQVLEVINVFT